MIIRRNRAALPVTDYRSDFSHARQWLGDRYLLATPINATPRARAALPLPLLLREQFKARLRKAES